MQVILKENVDNLGRIGDVVNVTSGYARNFLLPRGLVFLADEKNIALIEHHKKSLEKKRLALRSAADELAQKLSSVSCTITKKAGEKDKIFGSVHAQDIVESLKAQGFSIEKRMVVLATPIKTLGVHPVTIRLEPEVSAEIKVWIVKEA